MEPSAIILWVSVISALVIVGVTTFLIMKYISLKKEINDIKKTAIPSSDMKIISPSQGSNVPSIDTITF